MATNEPIKGAAAKLAEAALAPQPPQRTVKARVRAGGRYTVGDRMTGERKTYLGGEAVEVTERDYRAARQTLVTDADAATEKAEAVEAAKPEDHTALFRAFRHRARAATAQKKQAADVRQAEEITRVLRAAGLKVVPIDAKG